MKFNWTIFAVPCALAGLVSLSTVACTITSEVTPVGDGGTIVNRSDAGDAAAVDGSAAGDCEVNAAAFSDGVADADGGVTQQAACKACLTTTDNCSAVAAVDADLMQCFSGCLALEDYGTCFDACGADPRYSANYASAYPAFEDALLRCPTECQIEEILPDVVDP